MIYVNITRNIIPLPRLLSNTAAWSRRHPSKAASTSASRVLLDMPGYRRFLIVWFIGKYVVNDMQMTCLFLGNMEIWTTCCCSRQFDPEENWQVSLLIVQSDWQYPDFVDGFSFKIRFSNCDVKRVVLPYCMTSLFNLCSTNLLTFQLNNGVLKRGLYPGRSPELFKGGWAHGEVHQNKRK